MGNMCGKVRHLSKESAEYHVGELGNLLGTKPMAYKCPRCGFWHVGYGQRTGNLSKKARRKRKEALARNKNKRHKRYAN